MVGESGPAAHEGDAAVIAPEKGRRYWNPWLAGVALGILVTVAFASGHYFGASRVFAKLAQW